MQDGKQAVSVPIYLLIEAIYLLRVLGTTEYHSTLASKMLDYLPGALRGVVKEGETS